MERNYQFRQRLLQVHQENIRDANITLSDNMVEINNRFHIAIPNNCGIVMETAALDFQDFLYRSMGISVAVKKWDIVPKDEPVLSISIGPPPATISGQSRKWNKPSSCVIVCSPQLVEVIGSDERGCAQGVYLLEDQMNRRKAPYLNIGCYHHSPVFSPRMVHSGYGLDYYPDAHLSQIAHAGMDAILIFVKGVDRVPHGYLDFNELVFRASKYGIDVYAYAYFSNDMHPNDEKAYEYYQNLYGQLFAACPGLKGIVLVGESVEFPSKDPRVSDKKYYDNTQEGVYTGKPTAGWFPCNDYGEWVGMVRRVIKEQKPDADIVFWTYNWGYAPEEDRLALIDTLPDDISLMVTFEMFDQQEREGLRMSTVDYTLSFPGPSDYFMSEAKRAKERGIRLYTQANSAGLTWDFGVIPYEPFPQQWVKRYQNMLDVHQEYGLTGVMESHHYGYWPSFISRIEKLMFTHPSVSGDEAITLTAKEVFGAELYQDGVKAWEWLSKGIEYYVPTNEDQYGPFRIGPAYPMVFRSDVRIPSPFHAHFGGNAICFTDYASDALYRITSHTLGNTGMIQQRLDKEIASCETMRGCFQNGRKILEEMNNHLDSIRRKDNESLINLVRFIENCVTTVIHVKQWNRAKWRIRSEEDSVKIRAYLQEIIAIGHAEITNAKATIPLVQKDSRLGWEPSMEYMCDPYHLDWKIRQTQQVIDQEIPRYIAQLGQDVS